MGYDIKRFEGDVDEELICPICSGVLEDPLQVCGLYDESLDNAAVFCYWLEKNVILWMFRRPLVSTRFVAPASRSGSAASPPAP